MARCSWSAAALVVAAVGLLTLPGALATGPPASGPAPSVGPPPTVPPLPNENATLTLNPGHNLSSLFWGSSVSSRVHLLPNEEDLTAGTPVHVIVWPGAFAGDDYDPLANGARGVIWTYGNGQATPSTNESQFVTWCRSINCTAIFQVPGQIDNPTIAADIVAYTVNRTYVGPVWEGTTEVNVTMPGLDFRPAYWEIGNEPALWTSWDEPWGQAHYYSTPSATQYAQEEFNYIQAMDGANRSYVPAIIGLPGIGKASSLESPADWVDAVVSQNGANLSGLATHIYPARDIPSGQTGLVQFYNQLEALDPSSFAQRVGDQEHAIVEACAVYRCGPDGNASLPLFITEVGTSLSHSSFGGYSETFPGVIGMSLEAIQAMSLPNSTIASIDLYQSVADTTNSWFDTADSARPTYTLYSQIFTHLGSESFPINVTGDNNLSAVATIAPNDGGRRDLLVVNDNTTTTASFSTSFINTSYAAFGVNSPAAFAAGAPVEVWEWNATAPAYNATIGLTSSDPATPLPIATDYPQGLPAGWTLSPQSLALFETYNAPAYPVNFTANLTVAGYPPVSHWFIEVNGWRTSSTEPTLTLFLTSGSYVTSGYPLPMPPKGFDPKSRLMPTLPMTVVVTDVPVWVNVTFTVQWALNITWNESRGTVLAPALGSPSGSPKDGTFLWWNDSEPLALDFQPNPGYAFDRWDGEGSGSFSGYSLTATIAPVAPVEEQAIFHPGTEVTYVETGLATGTPWSVSVRGYSQSSTGPTDTFYEVNGTWSDLIENVSGYQLITPGEGAWWQNTLVVGNASMVVPVDYTAFTPPAPFYPVTFTEVGLAVGTDWSITVRNGSGSAIAPAALTLPEQAGAYGFGAGAPGGYVLASPLYFTVAAGPLAVTVDFLPANRVIWNETGLAAGLNWSVVVDGVATLDGGGWVTDQLFNGSYVYSIPGVQDYVPSPRVGTVDLTGDGAVIDVRFVRATFGVTFALSGLPAGAEYQVRLSNLSELTAETSFTFQLPNSTASPGGAYTFDVQAPAGHFASPSHGNVTVRGQPDVIEISIFPIGPGPNPPLLGLVLSASSAAIALGLAGVGSFLLLGAIRRRRRAPDV
jgi:hypothetical protein